MCGLKLIWRLLAGKSLWSKWIKANLLRKRSFWEVNIKSQTGSWMWRKMLKLREIAKSFYRKEIGNGRHTSFWLEKWSDRGVIYDLLGARGFIDLGIRKEATVEEAVFSSRRRRRHRVEILNDIEVELTNMRTTLSEELEDVSLWRRESGYHASFFAEDVSLRRRE